MPREFIKEDDYTGEIETVCGPWKTTEGILAPIAEVRVHARSTDLSRRVAVFNGDVLGWVGILSFRVMDSGDYAQIGQLVQYQLGLTEEQKKFIPPKIVNGVVKGAVLREKPCEVAVETGERDSKEETRIEIIEEPSLTQQQSHESGVETVTPEVMGDNRATEHPSWDSTEVTPETIPEDNAIEKSISEQLTDEEVVMIEEKEWEMWL